MKEIIKLILALAIFSIGSAALLSYTYSKTRPLIEAGRETMKFNSMRDVLPEAQSFSKIEKSPDFTEYYEGRAAKNALIGYILEGRARGYSSDIIYLASVGNELSLRRVLILSEQETPGLGTKIEEPKFIGQFANLSLDRLRLKKDDPAGVIDAVTSATISSRALTNSINELLAGFIAYHTARQKKQGPPMDMEQVLVDGNYEGSTKGFAGEITVSVLIEDGRISEIESIKSIETKNYAAVFSTMTAKILEKQSVKGIDAVTGATFSSVAINRAVGLALKKARAEKIVESRK